MILTHVVMCVCVCLCVSVGVREVGGREAEDSDREMRWKALESLSVCFNLYF